ncbi:IS200/IS605 family transposase [Alteromonas macleodii]|uniref:IS200/IS605 family transposase n=1 Tax=Alteromonas macleodii TaxID=28108 RepID=UPI0031404BBD
MQQTTSLKTKNHSAFKLHYHMVFVIKYRHKVINIEIMDRMRDIFDSVLAKWDCSLVEFGAEEDHVHLLFEAHPSMNLARLAGNLKTVSARHIRKEFEAHLSSYFWKPYFWSRAYAVTTTGGASLGKVKEYVLSQEQPSA